MRKAKVWEVPRLKKKQQKLNRYLSKKRLDLVREKLSGNPMYKICHFCNNYRLRNYSFGLGYCRLKRQDVKEFEVCPEWKINGGFVRVIAFKTNLFEDGGNE